MKKSTKLIAMLTVITLLTGLLAVAVADDKIYTSDTFVVPRDRVDESELPPEEEKQPEETQEPEPTPEEPEEEPVDPDAPVERKVIITSSRKDTVIDSQWITLYSKLVGFDGVEVYYQWQADRGDGAGWVDVEGATNPTHTFVATRETVLYNWRLIVTTDE